MRKIISYSLFFLLSWQIIGFVVYFEFSHHYLKKEIKTLLKKGVPKDELVIFEFDKDQMKDLIWLKKNEFDLNGNLFDVVRSHKTGSGKIYMECISDKKETILFANLNQTISINLGDDQHPTPISNWAKILHFPVISGDLSLQIPHIHGDEKNKSFFTYLDSFSVNALELISPPPKFIS